MRLSVTVPFFTVNAPEFSNPSPSRILMARKVEDGGGDEGLLAGVRRQDLFTLFDGCAGPFSTFTRGCNPAGGCRAP